MKKFVIFIAVLFVGSFILIGCSDDNDNANNNQNNEGNNVESNNDNIGDNNSQNEDNDTENNSLGNDNNEGNETDSSFEPDAEDQEGLGIGDTGKFDTIVGSYEVTLDEAELLGNEVDEIASQADDFILLDITIKNTGDETQSIEDIVEDMVVTDDPEGRGTDDVTGVFDSYEKFEGELDPDEEESGQFITEVYESDTYYFMYDAGSAGAGASNQVIWEFEPEKE